MLRYLEETMFVEELGILWSYPQSLKDVQHPWPYKLRPMKGSPLNTGISPLFDRKIVSGTKNCWDFDKKSRTDLGTSA
jgi:hypothetical protein